MMLYKRPRSLKLWPSGGCLKHTCHIKCHLSGHRHVGTNQKWVAIMVEGSQNLCTWSEFGGLWPEVFIADGFRMWILEEMLVGNKVASGNGCSRSLGTALAYKVFGEYRWGVGQAVPVYGEIITRWCLPLIVAVYQMGRGSIVSDVQV